MNYRIQDFIKLIIPGLYVVSSVFIWQIFFSDNDFDTVRIKEFSNLFLLIIPFLGFVVGYFIECLMSFIEHLFYLLGGTRPSKHILCNSYPRLYYLDSSEKICSQYEVSGKISNDKANELLQIAKQHIERDKVEGFRLNSMLARNIFGGQLLITILYSLVSDLFYKDLFFYVSLIVSALFFLYWFHHTHIYVKYVFADYGCKLKIDN